MKILKHIFPGAFAYKNFSDGKMPISRIHENLRSDLSASWPEKLFPHKFAVKYYNDKKEFIAGFPTCFSRYSPSYALSNENMREFAKSLNPFGKQVLTTAGAGDQATWFTKYGASSVDSFDISYCSKIVSELSISNYGIASASSSATFYDGDSISIEMNLQQLKSRKLYHGLRLRSSPTST